MSWSTRRRALRTWALLCGLLAASLSACGESVSQDPVDEDTAEESGFVSNEDRLEALIATGLEDQLPPLLEDEVIDLYDTMLHRQQVADDMTTKVAAAMVPLVIAASFFAIDGAADLILTIFPADKLGDAVRVGRDALKLRKQNKRAHKLLEFKRTFELALDDRSRELARIAMRLKPKQIAALKAIHEQAKSPELIHALVRKQLEHQADVVWIHTVLKRGAIDGADARRFTFDADVIEEFTRHAAGPSWKTLELVAKKQPVSDGARDALAAKVKGLLGERAATAMVTNKHFARKYLDPGNSFVADRGVGYRRYGTSGSLDVVAYSERDQRMLFAEVKHWGAERWASSSARAEIFEQLKRHDAGVDEILSRHLFHTSAGKLLMVSERGFMEGLTGVAKREFDQHLKARGWTLELIPDEGIASFAQMIDAAR